jgi:hypothetical protein
MSGHVQNKLQQGKWFTPHTVCDAVAPPSYLDRSSLGKSHLTVCLPFLNTATD